MIRSRTLVQSGAVFAALAALALLLFFGLPALTTQGADHLDAPGATPPGGIAALDITDIYAFKSPEKRGRTALVLNVNPLTAPGVKPNFLQGGEYRFNVDNTGDAVSDVIFTVQFSGPLGNGAQKVSLSRWTVGQGAQTLLSMDKGRTTPPGKAPVINTGSHTVRLFAGLRDDPFFFDLNAFNKLDFCKPGKDTFAGTNVSAIVLEVPNSLLKGAGTWDIGVWGETRYYGVRYDRMGIPATNTVFLPNNPLEPVGSEPTLKHAFNQTNPDRDEQRFRREVVDSLRELHALNDGAGDDPSDDEGKVQGLADFLLPDLLPFKLGDSKPFPNGRGLDDDVIDTALSLFTEVAVPGDCVNKNDKANSAKFPHLAAPHK